MTILGNGVMNHSALLPSIRQDIVVWPVFDMLDVSELLAGGLHKSEIPVGIAAQKKLFFRTNGINCVFPLPAGGIPATFGQRRLRRVPFCFYPRSGQARFYDKKASFLLIKRD